MDLIKLTVTVGATASSTDFCLDWSCVSGSCVSSLEGSWHACFPFTARSPQWGIHGCLSPAQMN